MFLSSVFVGTGEVTRYIGKYGASGCEGVLIGTDGPYSCEERRNPEGVDRRFSRFRQPSKSRSARTLMEFCITYQPTSHRGAVVSETAS